MNERRQKAPIGRRASEVFALSLRETRTGRGMSQSQLAGLVTKGGLPLGASGLSRIESGDRGISLDEALALALHLNASPAHLLTPPDGSVALSDNFAIDGPGLREWLRFGLWNWDTGGEPTGDVGHEEGREAQSDRQLTSLALLLVDAARKRDNAALKATLEALKRVLEQDDHQESG